MKKRSAFTLIELLVVFAILGILLVIFGRLTCSGFGAFEKSTDVITVNDKYPLSSESGTSYRIETTTTEGDEVFEISDSFLDGQFLSADLYAKLKRDHQYAVRCRGYRSGRWSSFRVIVEIIEEIPIE